MLTQSSGGKYISLMNKEINLIINRGRSKFNVQQIHPRFLLKHTKTTFPLLQAAVPLYRHIQSLWKGKVISMYVETFRKTENCVYEKSNIKRLSSINIK